MSRSIRKPDPPQRDTGPLTPLTPRFVAPSEEGHIAWRTVLPRGEESCRWQRFDGYWVTITLEPLTGTVRVADAHGRAEHVASYEGALDLASSWRS